MNIQYSLAEDNFHVASGDVLLLKSSHKGLGNRAGQSISRLRLAQFTHVAVVVDHTKIVDAMPGVGVSFRHWRDIEAKYDIQGSRVLRHSGLAADPGSQARVLRGAIYFIKQPYKLSTLLRNSGRVHDQSGMVCSHFVAALMERLDISISRQPATATLPIDIDTFTRSVREWKQFELKNYGIFSGALKPEANSRYWHALYEHSLFLLTSENPAEWCLPPTGGTNSDLAFSLDGIESILAHSTETIKQSANLLQRIEEKFEDSIELQFGVSRLASTFENVSLAMIQQLVDGLPKVRDSPISMLESKWLSADSQQPITGAALLELWDDVYRNEPRQPIFLHEENRNLNRDRYRAHLDQWTREAREFAAIRLQMFDELTITIGKVCEAAKVIPIDREILSPLTEAVGALQNSARFLLGEDSEAVNARVEHISLRKEILLTWARDSTMDRDTLLRAVNTWDEIFKYDLDIRHWHQVAEPALKQWIKILRQ